MNLTDLRKKINVIDSQLVPLLNQRAALSKEIGSIKQKKKKNVYSPEREKEILKRLQALNKGPISEAALRAIYREIMSSSLELEDFPAVAYFGTEGSFTLMAAKERFGNSVRYTSCNSILEVFRKVETGGCGYGVVPVENSIEGAVTHTFDLLVDSNLKICSQVLLKISHNLLSKTTLKNVQHVYSNPNALGQCRNWLSAHLPHVSEILVSSTTQAAQRASKDNKSAAIASSLAAQVYSLKVLKRDIQDIDHNTTRFFVIGTQDVPPTGKDRTSILFSIKDKVGALHDMLVPFKKNKINLTKIESRPSKKKAWDYYFFVDFEGHRLDPNVQKALSELEEMCKFLKLVGSYPIVE
jgi:chorismate mutase/prephenate dehydratase